MGAKIARALSSASWFTASSHASQKSSLSQPPNLVTWKTRGVVAEDGVLTKTAGEDGRFDAYAVSRSSSITRIGIATGNIRGQVRLGLTFDQPQPDLRPGELPDFCVEVFDDVAVRDKDGKVCVLEQCSGKDVVSLSVEEPSEIALYVNDERLYAWSVDDVHLNRVTRGMYAVIYFSQRDTSAFIVSADMLNFVDNRLCIVGQVTKIRKDTLMKRFVAGSEYQISFQLKILEVPDRRGNILDFVLPSETECHVPRINLQKECEICDTPLNGTTFCRHCRKESKGIPRLVLDVQLPNFAAQLRAPNAGIPLNEFVIVWVGIGAKGYLSLSVGGEETKQVVECCTFAELSGATVYVYAGNTVDPPAPALVDQVTFHWQLVGTNNHNFSKDNEPVPLAIPEAERNILDSIRHEIPLNKRWMRFDSFFGIFVIINSVWIGVSMEYNNSHYQEEDNKHVDTAPVATTTGVAIGENLTPTGSGDGANWEIPKGFWTGAEVVFLALLVIEFTLRIVKIMGFNYREYFRSRGRHRQDLRKFRPMDLDAWLLFDTCVIFIAVYDLYTIFQEPSQDDSPNIMSSIRLVRLLKLAKMVRLVRAFRSLGLLVEAVRSALLTVFWTIVLLLVGVLFSSVFIVKSINFANLSDEEKTVMADWQTVTLSLRRLVQMATWDDWAFFVRSAFLDVGGVKGFVFGMVFLLITTFFAMGVMNMVIGALCHISFSLDMKQKRMVGAEQLVEKQQALGTLRAELKTLGLRPLFADERFVTYRELMAAVDSDEFRNLLHTLGLSRHDFEDIGIVFEEQGQIEVDGIIEAVGVILLQRYFSTIARPVDCVQPPAWRLGDVRPIDLLFFSFSMRIIEKSVAKLERGITSVCSLAFDVVSVLEERAHQANCLVHLSKAAWRSQKVVTKTPKEMLVAVRHMVHYVNMYKGITMLSSLSTPLDMVGGTAVILNCIMTGIIVANNLDDSASMSFVYILDIIFTLIFVGELIVRAVLFANVKDLKASEHRMYIEESLGPDKLQMFKLDMSMEKVQALRCQMRFYLLPPCPNGGYRAVIRRLPMYLASDPFTFFDSLLVLLSAIDVLALTPIRFAGGDVVDTSVFAILRAFRIIRLVKVLRVLRLFPQLQEIVYALSDVMPMVIWTVLLSFVSMYTFGVMSLVLVGHPSNDEEDQDNDTQFLSCFFGSLDMAMLTGWQLLSLDDWGQLTRITIARFPVIGFCLCVSVLVISLAVMNMTTGVICTSAVKLVVRSNEERAANSVQETLFALEAIIRYVKVELGTSTITTETIEAAIQRRLRPRLAVTTSDSVEPSEICPEVQEKGVSPRFSSGLRKLFKRAQLSATTVKQIFEKMDYERQGYLDIECFCSGALAMKEDLGKLDIFASKTALQMVRARCMDVNNQLSTCHHKLGVLIEEMAALILRKDICEEDQRRRMQQPEQADFLSLAPAAQQEVSSITDYPGTGALPSVLSLGQYNVASGVGEVKIDGLDLWGRNTSFREQVAPGDYIIIETKANESGRLVTKAQPIQVVAMPERSRLRIERTTFITSKEYTPYYVVKVAATSGTEGALNSEFPPCLNAPPRMSPRSAQTLFRWDMRRKDVDMNKMKLLIAENRRLSEELREEHKLREKFDDLLRVRSCFDALKQPKRKGKR